MGTFNKEKPRIGIGAFSAPGTVKFREVPLTAVEEAVPVVHEDVWFPEVARGHSNILHHPIFRLVPFQINISPLLKCGTISSKHK